jgi:hypothetical protein
MAAAVVHLGHYALTDFVGWVLVVSYGAMRLRESCKSVKYNTFNQVTGNRPRYLEL